MKRADYYIQAIRLLSLTAFIFGLSYITSWAQLSNPSVTAEQTSTNFYSKYTFGFDTGNGNGNDLTTSNNISLTFPAEVTLPSSIATSQATIAYSTNQQSGNSNPSSISISGQTVTMGIPFSVPKGATITVTILEAANIRNPASAASFDFNIDTDNANHAALTVSETYTTTTTQVTSAAVTPNPSVQQRSAKYTIGFEVGQGGYLTQNSSTITITFPASTTVPSGSVSGIKVNSTAAAANASGSVLTVTSPINVDNQGSVTVTIPEGAGFKNPSSSGDFTLDVHTSSETTDVTSSTYSISSLGDISFSSISTSNDTVNATSAYDITFLVSDDLDGDPLNKGAVDPGEYIVFFFPSDISLPGSISPSNVTVENEDSGFASNPNSINISSSASGDTVFIENPIQINDGESVNVTFSENVGIQQPVIANNYSLSASTRETGAGVHPTYIDSVQASNPFAIRSTSSTVSQASVSLSNAGTNNASTYTLDFTTGKYGRLKAGTSTITVAFDGDYDMTTIGTVTVNSTTASTTTSGQDLIITVPASVNITNSDAVTLGIDVTNPGTETSYTLGVSTSVESTVVNSASYTIGGSSLNTLSLTTSNGYVNQADAFNFQFTDPGTYNNDNNAYFQFVFPAGTTVPSSIANGDVTFTHSGGKTFTFNSVSTDPSTRTVTVYFDAPNGGNSNITFDVDFATTAGIINPTVPRTGYYEVLVSSSKSSQQSALGFDIASNPNTSVTVDNISLSPSTKSSTNVQYEVAFTTGTNGKLVGGTTAGSSTIDITFNGTGTTLPGSMSTNDVTVNGNAPSSANISGNTVTLGVPNGVSISASSSVTVTFTSGAGIDNGSSSGSYTMDVSTSSTSVTSSSSYSITDSSPLSIGSFSKNETKVNATSSYSINFTPGTGNGLVSADADYIELTFPDNTYIPPSVAKQYVIINGNQVASTDASNTNRTLKLYPSTDLPAGSEASISISSTAGILNPTPVSSTYKLSLGTSKEAAVQSTSYSTTAATSTVTTPSVSLSDNGLNATGVTYTISLNTGDYGRLIENGGSLTASTIYVSFPSGTDVTGVNNTNIAINGAQPSSINRSGDVLEIPVPNMDDPDPQVADSIWNADDITITVAGVQNPGSSGDYTLDVKTSVENDYITSTSYPITNASPISLSNFGLTVNEVNIAGDYSFDFTTGTGSGLTTANSDYITITFPSSSEIPTSIANSDITIDGSAANNITTNSLENKVTVYVPADIAQNTTASLAISTNAGIINPKEPETNYTLTVFTSQQPVSNTTNSFTINESSTTNISNLGVSVSPQDKTIPVTWTWGFRTGAQGALEPGIGTIQVDFDQSIMSEVPDPMPTTAIKVNGEQISSLTYPHNSDSSQVLITVPSNVTIGNSDTVTVIFSDAAGIKLDPNLPTGKSTSTGGSQTLGANNYTADTSAEGGETSTSNPLPIALTSFKADIPEGTEEPVIRWSTATERENFGFYIDRTFVAQLENGKSKAFADTNWTEIHFMEGAGTTTQQSNYEFKDETVTKAGVYLYRIRQVDNDGKETFYGPIELRYEAPDQFKLNQNYPNPFNPTTKIEYSVAQQSNVRIDVYNILGQRVQTLVNREQLAGTYNVQFDGKALASGVYLVRMMANGNVFTKKMMLMK
jgi:hypothetical protein